LRRRLGVSMRDVFSTVLVVSSGLLREGLARILRAAHFQILSSATALDDSVLNSLSRYQSVLLVIGSGDDPDATARQIELFKKKHRSGRVAVVADHYQLSDVISAFRAGADAYLVKVTNYRAFVKALESVMLGATIMPSEVLQSIFSHEDEAINRDFRIQADPLVEAENNSMPHLSIQEKRILRHLVDGDSNKVIARKIDIAEATVKVHIKAILRKTRVHNRTQAAIWAVNNGSFAATIASGLDDLETKANFSRLYSNGHEPVALPKE
jgi:DNA-binding NarL/FixJ family response regulator